MPFGMFSTLLFFFPFFSSPLQITMLINNAGVVSGRALLDTPDHLIERSFNVNVLAHFWVCFTSFHTVCLHRNVKRYNINERF